MDLFACKFNFAMSTGSNNITEYDFVLELMLIWSGKPSRCYPPNRNLYQVTTFYYLTYNSWIVIDCIVILCLIIRIKKTHLLHVWLYIYFTLSSDDSFNATRTEDQDGDTTEHRVGCKRKNTKEHSVHCVLPFYTCGLVAGCEYPSH